jgi:hypothetical protein
VAQLPARLDGAPGGARVKLSTGDTNCQCLAHNYDLKQTARPAVEHIAQLSAAAPLLKSDPLGGALTRAVSLLVVLSVLSVATSCRQKQVTLSGTWTLCIAYSLARSSCGTAVVGKPDTTPGMAWHTHYPFTHLVNLAPVLPVRAERGQCGSLLLNNDSTLTLLVGILCGNTWEADGGNLSAERLRLRNDTISGSWYQHCFSGCTAHGSLSFIRSSEVP